MNAPHLTREELEANLEQLRQSPKDGGTVDLITRRPDVDQREILDSADLDVSIGVVGDTWNQRGSSRTPDGSPHPDMQVTLMNSRAIALIARSRERWPLAGDQLYVDLDLSEANVPAGTRLAIGTVVLEVTPQPHTGCMKFVERFGLDAMKFVNSPVGRELHLRGINARVVKPGTVRVGDTIERLPPS